MQDGISVGAGIPPLTSKPPCATEDGSLCRQMYEVTHVDWLARYADSVVDGTLSILTIMIVAFGLRLLVHRAINRLTSRVSEGRAPSWLRTRERGQDRGAVGHRPQSTERRSQRARTIGSLLRSMSSFMIYGIAFIMVLAEFGVDVAPILASAGVLGLAIGFGAQNLVRDFLSGIFMMIEDQYGVGDWVDLGEAKGTVEAVGMRVTTLRDTNGTVWHVRNGEVHRVGNASQGHSVAVVDVPIGHDADISAALEVAGRVATELTGPEGALRAEVQDLPEVLGVESINADCVSLRITVRVRAGRRHVVQRALLAAVLAGFADNGIPPPSATDAGPPPP